LKVGAPVQSKSGGTDPAQSAGNFFCRVPQLFGCKSTISRFGERFRDGQYSLVSFLFAALLLTVPPPVPHGVGATAAVVEQNKLQQQIYS